MEQHARMSRATSAEEERGNEPRAKLPSPTSGGGLATALLGDSVEVGPLPSERSDTDSASGGGGGGGSRPSSPGRNPQPQPPPSSCCRGCCCRSSEQRSRQHERATRVEKLMKQASFALEEYGKDDPRYIEIRRRLGAAVAATAR